jgi:hypothetical protein
MKQYGQQIAQFANKIAQTQKQLQQQQAAQQQAGMAMSNLRGAPPPGMGASAGPPGAMIGGAPAAPPAPPVPGMAAGNGPVMPPMGLPTNGATP